MKMMITAKVSYVPTLVKIWRFMGL